VSEVARTRPDDGPAPADPTLPIELTPADDPSRSEEPRVNKPLYPQLLQLENVHPNAWQRALLGEGMALLGALLAMADLASVWSILVLPVAVAGVVKAHDLLAGVLRTGAPRPGNDEGAASPRGAAPRS
jgi:hypothetical protein